MNHSSDNTYNVKIEGNVSGKVAVGSNINQVDGAASNTAGPAEGNPQPLPPDQRQKLQRVRHFLTAHFNEEELRNLAFDLGVDYEDLAGTGKSAKVRELLLHLQKQNRLEEVIQAARAQRPLVEYES